MPSPSVPVFGCSDTLANPVAGELSVPGFMDMRHIHAGTGQSRLRFVGGGSTNCNIRDVAAFEQPALFLGELRKCTANLIVSVCRLLVL